MAKPDRTSTKHVLHFGDLSPRDFERLCLWMLRAEGFENVDHIGAAGKDDGCDLSATKDGRRWVCQCKRVIRFGPKAAEKEIDKIVDWAEDERPDEILFLVTCDVSAETRRRARKKADPMGCTFWPLTDLDQRVKAHDEILAEFFQGPRPDTDQRSYLHQIPEPVADFVGREGEIKELLAAFDGAGQGAVIMGARGMAGVGKTELAKVLAKRLKGRFPDGHIYFNLRGASDDDSTKPATAAEALSHVIRSFDRDAALPEDVDSLQGICHSVLAGKRVLVLMDNARDAGQLGPMTPPPDGCALMVTSRHHFVLTEMKTIDLDTLPPEKARDLLLKVCSRIGEKADALAERCGYLPLALRLAASALETHKTIEVEDYLADLGAEKGRLATLDKYKGWSDEKRGVEASLAISYNLLDEGLQGFWRGPSVFPGDFDSTAAGSVWPLADGHDADGALGDLYAASMAQWDAATGRFRLHDLARDYALGQLSEEERAGAEHRHAAHYVAVLWRTDRLYKEGGDSILQGLGLFDREWGNIEAGQAWAADRRGTDKTAAELCSDYPDAGVYCLSLRLHSRDRIAWLEAAVEAARTLKNRHAEGNHLGNLGSAYRNLGDPRKAIEFYEQALVIDQEIGDRRGEGVALGSLGLAYADLGDPRKAIELYERRLDIARAIGDRRGEGNVLGNLGIAYADLGDPRKAIEFYEQQLVIVQEIGDRLGEGNALGNLGIACGDLGDPRKAIEYHEQALVISREIEDRRGEGNDLGNLGLAYADLGDARKAIEYHQKNLDIAREIGDRRGEGSALGNLGVAYKNLGDPRKAIEFYEQHRDIARAIGDRRGEGNALGNLGNAYKDLGDPRKAIEFYEEVLVIHREIGDRRGEGSDLGNLGSAYAALGDPHKAIEFYEQALVIDQEIGDRSGEAIDFHNLAGELSKVGRGDEAIAYAETAVAIFEQIESPHADKARALLEGLREQAG